MYRLDTNDYYTPFFLKSSLFKIILVAFTFNALAFLSFRITVSPDNLSPIFPDVGFALAAVLIVGRKAIGGVWIGSFVANMFSFWDVCQMLDKSVLETILSSASVATGVAIGVTISAYLINLVNKGEYPLKTGFSVIVFLGISVLYCGICSVLCVSAISFWGLSTPNHFVYNWITLWKGDLIGTILITPFLISWFYRHHIKIIATSLLEAVLLGLSTVLVCVLVAFDHPSDQYLFILILLWATFRFRIRGVSILASMFALLSSIYGYLGYGSFVVVNSEDSLININPFFGITTVITLILSGYYSDYLHRKLETSKS
ncbi:MASE1 domain-containing protein [Flavobacterium aquicola]|uniref:Integral membrane sensor domain MASE1 n=1 Tax=Flavobacterium aquicola TaxID=1682742 RepID=A0A3E0DXU0_9FLAO|nr:MASE1 domain-containing protein [Flavobacterium aquicola]REG90838.1 integral membrane sensor domain MASE1 [Flavobacterium aquicola]